VERIAVFGVLGKGARGGAKIGVTESQVLCFIILGVTRGSRL